jgi:hypothetical protein
MSPVHRWVLKFCRTVHVYLTLFGLVLLTFFAVTGFLLNHYDWFVGEPTTRTASGVAPAAMLQPLDKLAVVEWLRREHGAGGLLDSFDEEEESLRVVFKSPGRRVEAIVQRGDGQTALSYESHGLLGLLTDLHRGNSAGAAWGLVIDGLCVLVLIVSATGLVLWSSLRARGKYGSLVLLLGLAVALAVYFVFVP